jgi:hypothetical protein
VKSTANKCDTLTDTLDDGRNLLASVDGHLPVKLPIFLFYFFISSHPPRSDDGGILIIWCFFFFSFLSLPRGRFSSSSFGYDERRNEVLERAEGD